MSQGILERIEAKLDALALAVAQGTPLAATVEETAGTPLPPVEQTPPSAPAVDSDVELDSDGVPWDERIHSSNQKRSKGGKGAWMKRKNVDKDEFARITAELRERCKGQSGATQPHVVDDEPQDVESQKSAPPPPAGSHAGKVNTNTPPPAPGKAAAPPPPATAAEVPSRKEAIEAINVLTSKHSINYDAIVQYFVDNYNVSGFEEIPPQKFAFVSEDCTTWAARLTQIATQIADIKQVYVNDVSVIEPYIAQCWSNATLDGEPCANYTDVPFDQLDAVSVPLLQLHEQCKGV